MKEYPPRLMVLFFNDGSYQIQHKKLLAGSKPYLSLEEAKALLKDAADALEHYESAHYDHRGNACSHDNTATDALRKLREALLA